MISSQKDSFLKAYKEGKNFIPIVETWPADLETPLSTWLKLSSKDSHGVFLESVEGGENLGRWSIVATKPLWEAVCYGEEIVKTWNNGKTEKHTGDPFDILRSWTKEYNSTMLDDLPSIGQLYGSWGYELINQKIKINPLQEISLKTEHFDSVLLGPGTDRLIEQINKLNQLQKSLPNLLITTKVKIVDLKDPSKPELKIEKILGNES